MSYLQITNEGEIDPRALTLMGASTKRGDENVIGFFGTGNKYALAKFLRDGLDVQIYSGLRHIQITTVTEELGTHEFTSVMIDGRHTSMTTAMGPTWELWQAIREVYSNALDAGKASISVVDSPSPSDGNTTYCIEADDDVLAVMRDFNLYFSTGREPIEKQSSGTIYPNGSGTVYRKSIRCVPVGGKSLYDYDLSNVSIGEDRLASYPWQVSRKVWNLLLNTDNESIVANALSNANDSSTVEGAAAESSITDFPPTVSGACKEWLRNNLVADPSMGNMMTDREKSTATILPSRMLLHLINLIGKDNILLPASVARSGSLLFSLADISKEDSLLLANALKTIEDSGISIPYPIIVGKFDSPSIMGLADRTNMRIVLADTLFSMGDVMIVGTILEEWIHLKHGVDDKTRAMQSAIFNEFATLLVKQETRR